MKMDDARLLRSRLRRYERKLAEERHEFGHYSDGAGRRYFVGPHYLLLGDLEGALRSFKWFEAEFPDDTGEPGHSLCWSLALHRASMKEDAVEKLKQAALLNLHVLPHLLGDQAPDHSDLWLGSNQEWPEYVEHIPTEYFQLWSMSEREWARSISSSPGFTAVVNRWIEIHAELKDLPRGERRTRLVKDAWLLRSTPTIL